MCPFLSDCWFWREETTVGLLLIHSFFFFLLLYTAGERKYRYKMFNLKLHFGFLHFWCSLILYSINLENGQVPHLQFE